MPERSGIRGLLALMLLHDARRSSRETIGGDIVLLEHQDRSLWDQAQIAEGLQLVETALSVPGRPDPYAVQGAIAALHARAPSFERHRLAADRRALCGADADRTVTGGRT